MVGMGLLTLSACQMVTVPESNLKPQVTDTWASPIAREGAVIDLKVW